MTESIQQWMADEATKYSEHSHDAQGKFIDGLTKGIEIAEGFAEWAVKNYFPDYSALGHVKGWTPKSRISEVFTTSQLLEKYLQYLSSINKEK